MAETITIEGSILTSAWLARGERQVVRADDPHAKFLVLNGYAIVVEANTVVEPEADEPEGNPADAMELDPPARNASRDDWAGIPGPAPGGIRLRGQGPRRAHR